MNDEAAEQQGDDRAELMRALSLISEAIEILDRIEAPADIAAHLDLGRHRLEAFIGAQS